MFNILIIILNIYTFVLIARALMSWIPNLDPSNPIVKFILQITEPVLQPIRQALPQTGGMDFSPLIVLVVISVLTRVLASF